MVHIMVTHSSHPTEELLGEGELPSAERNWQRTAKRKRERKNPMLSAAHDPSVKVNRPEQ